MKDIKFKVQINPFKQEAIINTNKLDGMMYTLAIYYNDVDEWRSFEVFGKKFDIHFLYDGKFTVSIYPVENKKANYSKPFNVKLTFKLTDK